MRTAAGAAKEYDPLPDGTPWYSGGLRFQCQRCSRCCRGAPGFVWVADAEITRMAHHLALSTDEFASAYVRTLGPRLSLIELPGGDCILWAGTERGCLVYPVRPIQCQTFPFWRLHLASPDAWNDLASSCPGANKGPMHSLNEIRNRLKDNPW